MPGLRLLTVVSGSLREKAERARELRLLIERVEEMRRQVLEEIENEVRDDPRAEFLLRDLAEWW